MIDKVVEHFREKGVKCKKVEDSRSDYGDFIAIFGYGNLTRKEIVQIIKDKDLLCIFFEAAIREEEYRKKKMIGEV